MLCSYGDPGPHKGPFSEYVAALQREHARVATSLVYWQDLHQLEPSPDTQTSLDFYEGWERELWNHIHTLVHHPDPYRGTETADDFLALEIARSAPLAREGRLDYAAIKARVDLVEYIGRVTELRPIGRNFKGLCPLHGEDTPSLWVYPETRSWYCFGCRQGGDLFDFGKAYANLSAAQIE